MHPIARTSSRIVAVAGSVLTLALAGLSPAGAAEVPGAGTYRGKGTELTTSADGASVTIERLPIRPKCRGVRPTNLGEDLGPFTIAANGSFDNGVEKVKVGSGNVALRGKFSRNGRTVKGTVEQAAFEDRAKDFDCDAYEGRFTAKLVEGTGLRPGDVLAEDDFSDPDSGFDTFNAENSYGEYLEDGRYRIGLRGPGAVYAVRTEPETSIVEVAAVVRWYGNDEQDAAGLVCQANGSSFTLGLVRGTGQVELKRYVDGEIQESATPEPAPDGLLKAGQGEANELVLTCVPDADGQGTQVTLSLNGDEVKSARTSSVEDGKTGFFVEDQAGGTEFNFSDYEARVPERSGD